MRVFICALAVACSSPKRASPITQAQVGEQGEFTDATSRDAATEPPATAPVVVEASAAEDLSMLESQLEHREVTGDGIEIDVSWWTLTGTWHLADELVISTARGTLRLKTREGDDGPQEALPLLEEIYPLGDHRWIVVGWSSFGEGMQTVHAWLVDGTSAPRIVDKLEWTTDRTHSGIVIDATSKVRIGIPLPVRSSETDDPDGERTLHNRLDWELVHGKRTFRLDQVAKLRTTEHHVMSVHAYTPPFQDSASTRGWSGRFVWFSAEKTFVRR